jgi:hypothetical protein
MTRDKTTRYYTIQTRWYKGYGHYRGRKPAPEIRIGGLWLAEQSFYPKNKIKVEIRKKYLKITHINQ